MNCSIAQSLALCSRTRCFRVCFTIRCGPRQPRTAARAIPISWAVSTLSRLYSTRKHKEVLLCLLYYSLRPNQPRAAVRASTSWAKYYHAHAHARTCIYICTHADAYRGAFMFALWAPSSHALALPYFYCIR